MTALTPENARPGLRVKCVCDEYIGPHQIRRGEEYEIEGFGWEGHIRLKGQSSCPSSGWNMHRFVLADPARPTLRALLAEHDPEFLAAVLGEYERWKSYPRECLVHRLQRLCNAIERANLHAPAEVQAPGVTDARATLDLEWWA